MKEGCGTWLSPGSGGAIHATPKLIGIGGMVHDYPGKRGNSCVTKFYWKMTIQYLNIWNQILLEAKWRVSRAATGHLTATMWNQGKSSLTLLIKAENVTVIQLSGSDLLGLPLLSTAHKVHHTGVLLQLLPIIHHYRILQRVRDFQIKCAWILCVVFLTHRPLTKFPTLTTLLRHVIE